MSLFAPDEVIQPPAVLAPIRGLRTLLATAESRWLLRRVGISQVGLIGNLVLGLAQSVILARTLGPAGLGTVASVTALTSMLGQFFDVGVGQLVVVKGGLYLARDQRPKFAALCSLGLRVSLVAGVGTALAAAAAIWWVPVAIWNDPAVKRAAELLALAAIGSSVVPWAQSVLRASDKFSALAAARNVAALTSLLIVSGTAIVTRTPSVVLIAYACAETIIGVGHYLLASQTIRTFRRDFHIVRPGTLGILADDRQELWRFCKLTWISSSCLMAYGRADEFIAGAAIGASASGLYKIAKNMIRIVISMSDALLETAYSQIARLWGAGASAELRRVVVTMTLTGGVFVGLSTAALLGLGRPVVMSMYGSAYAGTFSILQVLTLDLIYVPFLWFFPLMRASDRLGVSIKLELLAVATSLAVLSVASLNGSIIGIAFGRVAFDLVLVATTGFYITRNRQQLLAAI